MSDDLRLFLADLPSVGKPTFIGQQHTENESTTPVLSVTTAPDSENQPIKIVPKGLRSFDAHDADFFLVLLPGPRDREGLPDSIRFWKTRIEEFDPDSTFAVGLICGPSGCGKSSLVKAGLLPRLSDDIVSVYIEATPDETETRLLLGLRKHCSGLEDNLGLKDTLAAVRQGQCIPVGKKLLIVLDQFEQWLHAKKEEENSDLVQALRQCDGSKVQCIVMVRDDFWMAVIRFMQELEVRLLEGQNSTAVDLFPIRHAEKVLTAFGQAFGTLPDDFNDLSKEQKLFLTQSVAGLAEEGKVICVRLALFAEMMKGKVWTPSTLKEVGGTKGVGVTFLEETFSASTAPPERRYHQKAARAVLKDLLPASGTDIKGYMRSYSELLNASNYVSRPNDFDDLIRILDGDIRLITPTDPEGKSSDNEPMPQTAPGQKYFQLTHDYMVHSLREWLTRKQKETRRGRAELRLFDLSVTWNSNSDNRFLPSWWENLDIRCFTDKKKWTDPQRKMMVKAAWVHGIRTSIISFLLVAASIIGLTMQHRAVEQQQATYAAGLVQRLLDAETTQVPAIINETSEYRKWADPLLREENVKATATSRQKLHSSLALLPVDPTQVDALYDQLLNAEPHEVSVIVDALAPHKETLLGKLWTVVETPEKRKQSQRLRAAAALAQYDPDCPKWATANGSVVQHLVGENPLFVGLWMDGFRPIKEKLIAPLANIYRDASRRDSERMLATNILVDYAADQPQLLADLLMEADERQFAMVYPKFEIQAEQGLPLLAGEIDKQMPSTSPSSDESREKLAKRQANAAVALLRVNQPTKVWPLLQHSSDPRVRSYLIHRLGPLGADAKAILSRFDDDSDITAKRALILCLGEFGETELSHKNRERFTATLQEIYQTASDPGLHAAAEWLLKTWKQDPWVKQINREWASNTERREKWLEGILKKLANEKESSPQWYINGQGETMVVIPGPVDFTVGSPATEVGRQDNEQQHNSRINRTFAYAAKSVTVEHYRQFQKDYRLRPVFTRMSDLPVVGINWYMAASYCNWLSKQEGIPETQWCYEIAGDENVKLKVDSLQLGGYRLPTEAETEYATRAGAVTSRYFGEADDLLSKYAWYQTNSKQLTFPVGSLKPNDLGLFDTLGNVWTWCHDGITTLPQGPEADDVEEKDVIVASARIRVLRGGSILGLASDERSAVRLMFPPTVGNTDLGFRVARTLRPVPITPLPATP